MTFANQPNQDGNRQPYDKRREKHQAGIPARKKFRNHQRKTDESHASCRAAASNAACRAGLKIPAFGFLSVSCFSTRVALAGKIAGRRNKPRIRVRISCQSPVVTVTAPPNRSARHSHTIFVLAKTEIEIDSWLPPGSAPRRPRHKSATERVRKRLRRAHAARASSSACCRALHTDRKLWHP